MFDLFKLYKKNYKAFPEMIETGGKFYAINADFRNILRIFALTNDENIRADKKPGKIAEWFFEDDMPGHEVLLEAFFEFVGAGFSRPQTQTNANNGRDDPAPTNLWTNETHEPQFCFDFDAGEIYAGFLSEYDIDLISVDFLHWYKFMILLENLSPESAFKRKIELRFMDLSGLENNRRLTDAKISVQLPEKNYNTQDSEEFNEIWGKAGN